MKKFEVETQIEIDNKEIKYLVAFCAKRKQIKNSLNPAFFFLVTKKTSFVSNVSDDTALSDYILLGASENIHIDA